MSLTSADHDGARTDFLYGGNPLPVLNTSIGVRVEAIALYDAGALRRLRTFTYGSPAATGPMAPVIADYTTLGVKISAVYGNQHLIGDQYTWRFCVNETPVTEGPSVRDTRVVYGTVTEDVFDGTLGDTPLARTVRHFDTAGMMAAETSVLERFPQTTLYNAVS